LTKTDLSEWSKLNQNLRFLFTKKKFYNKFCFSLTYHLSGARCIINCKNPANLKEYVKEYNERNNHRLYRTGTAYTDCITDFYNLYRAPHGDEVKFRVCSYAFTIFSDDESYLYNLASNVLVNQKLALAAVSLLEYVDDKQLLDDGYILAKTLTDHPFKVRLKEGHIKLEDRHALVNYLKNLDGEVKASAYILNRLGDRYKYFQGGYIYVSDARVIDILKMISPSLIGSVNQIKINN